MSFNIEHEVGYIKGAVEALIRTVEGLEAKVDSYATSAAQALAEHEKHDNDRFDKVWKNIGRLTKQAAALGGGATVIGFLIEYFKS